MKISFKSRSPIGIDVGSRNMKVAQLCTAADKRQEISATSVVPRTNAGAEINLEEAISLRRVLQRQGFRGDRVVLAAHEDKLLRGIFDIPGQISEDAMEQIARMELSRMHDVAPDSFEMICWEPLNTGKSKTKRQTVALACPHDAANIYIDTFEQAGFKVCALDARSAAVARACKSLTLSPPAVTAILDLGWKSTRLLFLCGEAVVYERLLEEKSICTLASDLRDKFGIAEESAYTVIASIGFGTFEEAPELDQQSVGFIRGILVRYFEAMKNELKTPLAYVSREHGGKGTERMLLVGSGAMFPGISEYLAESFNMEVLTAAPSELLPSPAHVRTKACNTALTVACGLALFEMR